MKIRISGLITGLIIALMTTQQTDAQKFVTTGPDGQFLIGDSTYRFVGTNFWYGPILASDGPDGDRPRLHRELDRLQSLGIDNLRILVGAEGDDGLPCHISPILQPRPGEYNGHLLNGLDYLLAELERREMKAVLYLTNAWEWSGGYGTYLEWAGGNRAPVPAIDGYDTYVGYVKDFVLNDKAKQMAVEHARRIVSRTNSITGRPYTESPAIMAWQVANEPRAFSKQGKQALADWIQQMARTIKEIDSNHLVSTGSEGKYGCEVDLDLWRRIHAMPEIDYAIIHLWPTNWGWASRDSVEAHVAEACRLSDEYITEHLDAIAPHCRTLVIEEFGYPRDGMKFTSDSPTTARDEYYRFIYNRFATDRRISGINFWGWGGEAKGGSLQWQHGEPYTCDPAHEQQGLYSVFATDTTTTAILSLRQH